jgi:hypothetical protein
MQIIKACTQIAFYSFTLTTQPITCTSGPSPCLLTCFSMHCRCTPFQHYVLYKPANLPHQQTPTNKPHNCGSTVLQPLLLVTQSKLQTSLIHTDSVLQAPLLSGKCCKHLYLEVTLSTLLLLLPHERVLNQLLTIRYPPLHSLHARTCKNHNLRTGLCYSLHNLAG